MLDDTNVRHFAGCGTKINFLGLDKIQLQEMLPFDKFVGQGGWQD